MSEQTHILIVDDSAVDRALLDAYLGRDGFDTAFAGDGVEAWSVLDAHPDRFDLVLLDRTMPRMDGLELLRRIKADHRFLILPVILQSALNSRQEVIEGIRAGAYYYLTKPYDAEMLLSVVRTAAYDRAASKDLQKRVRRGLQVLQLLDEAHFTFRTIEEARGLAAVLANACPDAESTVIGLTELMVNAVEHGNLGITYDEKSALLEEGGWTAEVERRLTLPENRGKRVDVRFRRGDDELLFAICDRGNGFEWARYLDIDPRRAFDRHGRGILMARHVSFSSIEYRGCGNEVIATVRCGQPAAAAGGAA
ncbi:MAG TPA: response regulator [Thermoanaerobaculia bacterium]|jgi:CheY-like chemotaxis protein|nr:response regulator [Thermoanaerobaculia bacterium]